MWTTTSVHKLAEGLMTVDPRFRGKMDEINRQIEKLQEEKRKVEDEFLQEYYPYIKRRRDEAAEVLSTELEKEFNKARKKG
jgi:23S rRNA A2030 N6-methylase RlmJ